MGILIEQVTTRFTEQQSSSDENLQGQQQQLSIRIERVTRHKRALQRAGKLFRWANSLNNDSTKKHGGVDSLVHLFLSTSRKKEQKKSWRKNKNRKGKKLPRIRKLRSSPKFASKLAWFEKGGRKRERERERKGKKIETFSSWRPFNTGRM